jgi:hypothetical protein
MEEFKAMLVERPGRERRRALVPVLAALGFKLFYSAMSAVMTLFVTPDPELVRSNAFTEHIQPPSAQVGYLFVGVWEKFDTLWYIHIAREGYRLPESVVFFPLYPILIRLVAWVCSDFLVASLAVTTVASCLLFLGLYKLFSLDFSPPEVFRALIVCGCWPAAFVFFAGYPESLVLALAVWAVYFARTGRGVMCAVAGLGAGAAKAAGALIAVAVAALGRNWRERFLFAAAPLAAITAYFAWLRLRDLPLPGEAYARHWGTVVSYPWTTVSDVIGRISSGEIPVALNFLFFLLTAACALLPASRREYRLYAAAVICLLLIKLAPPDQQQWARYSLLLFPAYLNLARVLRDSAVFAAVVLTFLVANGLLLSAFLKWSLVV